MYFFRLGGRQFLYFWKYEPIMSFTNTFESCSEFDENMTIVAYQFPCICTRSLVNSFRLLKRC